MTGRPTTMNATLVIPALNEAGVIGDVVLNARREFVEKYTHTCH